MNTAFVLDLSSRGIRVLSGHEQPWQVLGEVSLDDPRLDDRLRELRRAGDAPMPGGPVATILVPRDEIFYAALDAAAGEEDQEARVREALAAVARGPLDDLAHDWTVTSDGRLRIAAVPRRVLREAGRFAVAHGFTPARFSARADAEVFPGWPDFGASEQAGPPEAVPGAAAVRAPEAISAPAAAASSEGATPVAAPVAGGPREATRALRPDGVPRPAGTRPRVGPAARGGHGRTAPGTVRPTAAGLSQPIRPDSDELRGRETAAAVPEPAPRARGRAAGALGIALVLLVAAGVWAVFLAPGGLGADRGADEVVLRAEPAAPPPAMSAKGDARRATGTARPPGDLVRASERRVADGAEAILLPVTFALAAPEPAAASGPDAGSREAAGLGTVRVTRGRPGVVPPARPALPAAAAGTDIPVVDESAPGSPSTRPGPDGVEGPADGTAPLVAEAEAGDPLDEAAIAPTGARPANATPPRPRPTREAAVAPPTDAIETAVATAVEAAPARPQARPRARPGGGAPEGDAAAPPADGTLEADVAAVLATIPPEAESDAVARSLRPGSRPGDLGPAEAPDTPVRVASAAPDAAEATPAPAPSASDATSGGMLRLDRMNLIGVYGSQSDRRALVRLPNGRFVKVRVGDRVDGGRVSAIGSEDLQYIKGGRAVSLSMPRG